MGDLSHDEVLSILNRMDAEQRTMESLMAARKQVREVIERYKLAVAELPSLEAAQSQHAQLMAELQKVADNEQTTLASRVQAKREEAAAELASCEERIAIAQAKALAAEQDGQDKEAFALKRGEQLDAEIKAKVAQLSSVEAALIDFKKQHGLG